MNKPNSYIYWLRGFKNFSPYPYLLRIIYSLCLLLFITGCLGFLIFTDLSPYMAASWLLASVLFIWAGRFEAHKRARVEATDHHLEITLYKKDKDHLQLRLNYLDIQEIEMHDKPFTRIHFAQNITPWISMRKHWAKDLQALISQAQSEQPIPSFIRQRSTLINFIISALLLTLFGIGFAAYMLNEQLQVISNPLILVPSLLAPPIYFFIYAHSVFISPDFKYLALGQNMLRAYHSNGRVKVYAWGKIKEIKPRPWGMTLVLPKEKIKVYGFFRDQVTELIEFHEAWKGQQDS